VASRTEQPPWRAAHGTGISQTVLVACAPFGPRLSAASVAGAIARGLQEVGLPEPDLCLLPLAGERGDGVEGVEDVRALVNGLGFDARMRRARAVVVAAPLLEERTLAGSVTFEIATRARQAGVPAYAVTGENALNAFDARILDLQVIVVARGRAALVSAGVKLAALA
jgi:glycerate kinase